MIFQGWALTSWKVKVKLLLTKLINELINLFCLILYLIEICKYYLLIVPTVIIN